MTFDLTIRFGWWLIPAAITVIAFVWASIETPRSGCNGIGDAVVAAFLFGTAIIASLVAWLIWALAT